MKITAGKWKGKNIEARQDRALRPTTSKVREAIFNILKHGRFLKNENYRDVFDGDILNGQRVVDIFCGTGILGLEALSRGAEHVTLVDGDSRTLDITRKNVRNLEANAYVMRSDSTRLSRAPKPCGLAFMDPPYHSNLADKALKSLWEQEWLIDGAIVIVEHGLQDQINPPDVYTFLDARDYNKTRITVLQFNQSG